MAKLHLLDFEPTMIYYDKFMILVTNNCVSINSLNPKLGIEVVTSIPKIGHRNGDLEHLHMYLSMHCKFQPNPKLKS